jgi:hypothetical protein
MRALEELLSAEHDERNSTLVDRIDSADEAGALLR